MTDPRSSETYPCQGDAPPDTVRFTSFRHDPEDPLSLSHNRVTCMARGADGRLWVGTKKGLNRMVSESPPRFDQFFYDKEDPTSLHDDEIYCLLADSAGSLWIGAWGGGALARLAVDEQKKEKPAFARYGSDDSETGYPSYVALDAVEDNRGNLWFCARDDGVVCLPKEYRDVPDPHFLQLDYDSGNPFGMSDGAATSLCADAQGLLWIANLDGGFNKYDPRKSAFRLYRHHPGKLPGLVEGGVSGIAEDVDGSLWIGTDNGLTQVIPGSNPLAQPRFVPHRSGPETSDASRIEQVSVLLLDSRERLWIGTINDGLFLREKRGDGFSFANLKKDAADPRSLGSDTVLSLLEDSQGRVWVGTYGGLYQMVEDVPGRSAPAFVAYRHKGDDPNTISNNLVEAIAEGPGGSIWVGTSSGLNRLDPETGAVMRYAPDPEAADSLPHEAVDSLLATESWLWVGTQGGLCRLDFATGAVTRSDASSPLSKINVKSLVRDGRGRVWVGTVAGLYRLDPDTGATVHYGKGDGFPADLAFRNAVSRGPSGTLYFGTPVGAVAFRPDDVEREDAPPPVVLTNLLLGNRAQSIQSGSVLPAALDHLEEITLRHTDNIVTIEFSALDFARPEQVHYAYRLEGLYDDWIETDAKNRRATFTNLPPGTFLLRVKAASGDGVWNENHPALRIVVLPPWWRTWWAYLFYAVTVVSVLYAGVWYRLRSLRKRGEELELLVERRTAELAASEHRALEAREEALEASRAKSVFLANMSHELRTPLNAVIGFAQVLERRSTITGEDRQSLGIIQRSGEHLLGLINDVLSLSKIEAGKLALVEAPFDLPQLLHAVQAIVRVRAEAKGLEVAFDVDPNLPRVVLGDEGKLRQVLINLLGNAVKFTERGRVTLRARAAGHERVAFDVEDTGVGIAEEELGKLFEAFVQTESGRGSKEGTGLGLVISRQIVRLMGGDVLVRSRLGSGTTFSFEAFLPESPDTEAARDRRRVVGLAPDQPIPRVLVVDDTDENRLLLVRLLTSIGIAVREAANGAEAVTAWEVWRPDLIFMDMRMPVVDGREATRRIRNDECKMMTDELKKESSKESSGEDPSSAIHHSSFIIHHSTKIVALTASAFEHERDEILACGADAFVTKPFRVETIFETLAGQLGVRFLYQDVVPEVDGAAAESAAEALTPARLASLPPERLGDLHEALGAGDFEAATAIAERIRQVDEPLGVALLDELRAFRLDELLSLIEQIERVR